MLRHRLANFAGTCRTTNRLHLALVEAITGGRCNSSSFSCLWAVLVLLLPDALAFAGSARNFECGNDVHPSHLPNPT